MRVIDSHTGGEPTRVVVEGGPDLGRGTMAERRELFGRKFDDFRSAVVNEPRGSDVIVGALWCEPADPANTAGVIFFNNIGPLWMCGHGTIGLGVTLGYLGRIQAGRHSLETAVGIVTFDYDGGNRVSLENVPSYRIAQGVTVDVDGVGQVTGDIAWGGNWFFLVDTRNQPGMPADRPLVGTRPGRNGHPTAFGIADVERLSDLAKRIRRALRANGITGANGAEVDHVELFGPPGHPDNHSRNFVLCPGGAYDRSPCGTGTSAKLACLHADGKLSPGQMWRQESILGSVFEGTVRLDGDNLIPRVTGTAYVNAEATLLLDPNDPFQMGIRG
ncbi:MAG: proline racemase family protein [Planctomycetes bacterium]|nr:proline racemase family protein [Planctomycetota bacterium]